MTGNWQRAVPVYNQPIRTRALYVLGALTGVAVLLALYRVFAGLGPASGMNDAYSWGIWKTFNVMVLTGLGSGGFAVGIGAWVFYRQRLHSVMRAALLISFLAYFCGLILLTIDVGRPWNLYWMLFPWNWNTHSPLLEVMVCMSVYAMFPLAVENVPPILERLYDDRPSLRPLIERAMGIIAKGYPYVIGLAYALPMMHQSSLGALMLLAGERVHTLWQTPWLPLLYVWAAAFMGYACVAGTLLFCSLMWKRARDMQVLTEMSYITAGLIASWWLFRVGDLMYRNRLRAAFAVNPYSFVFWLEMVLLAGSVVFLVVSSRKQNTQLMFHGHLLAAIGGALYRFNPTTFAFQAKPGAFYFPSAIEILISLGFVALGIAGFMAAVKLLPILPAPLSEWRGMEAHGKARSGLVAQGYAAAQD